MDKIQDTPSLKEIRDQAEQLGILRSAWPFLRPILKLIKIDVHSMEEKFPEMNELIERINYFASIPDRFNEVFAERGWIIHEHMDIEVAKKALEKAEDGDLEAGEAILVDYYGADTVEFWLPHMLGIEAYAPRHELALKALEDYRAERYHACVPVVLALIDGLVNEVHERRIGFFAKDANLTAWDSISAHGKGLNSLKKIFGKARNKTTAEQITIPYRHGIMHGRDLGYDNQIIAAKCWAALFSVKIWAQKSEKGELGAKPEKPEKSWREIFKQIAQNKRDKELIKAWKPRMLNPGIDFPKSSISTDYQDRSPEKEVVKFLELWKRNNYGFMANMLWSAEDSNPAYVRERYADKKLISFSIKRITDEAPAIAMVEVELVYDQEGNEKKCCKTFRLGIPSNKSLNFIRGEEGINWKLIWWDVEFEGR